MGYLDQYGYTGFFQSQADELPGCLPARVTAVHKERFEVVSAKGMGGAVLKSSVYFSGGAELFPTTGDFVMMTDNPYGDGLIVRTLKRKSCFVRRDPGPSGGELTVAANFDLVLILTSLNRDLNISRLERYLAASWQSGGTPVIVLTKADVAPDVGEAERTVGSACVGVDVVAISAHTGFGMDRLSAYLKPGVTAALLGSSGVGKSSLVNVLAGETLMQVREIREGDSRGRHTTSHRQLILLPSGVLLIDTPGMRALGLYDAQDGLERTFEELAQLEDACRFRDCTHKTEPGCAVLQATRAGLLTSERWAQYEKLKKEARYAQRKSAWQEKRQAKEKSRQKQRRDGKVIIDE